MAQWKEPDVSDPTRWVDLGQLLTAWHLVSLSVLCPKEVGAWL